MNTIFSVLLRTTIIFLVLLTLCRILGNKQISQLTYFNYITGITIGSIAGIIISISDRPYTNELIGLIWWCFLTILTGYICLKSGPLRRLIDGEPKVIIKKGKIQRKVLHAERLNMDDLLMLLRKQSIFSILEVEYAIMEPDGTLSVLKKDPYLQVTKANLNIPPTTISNIPSEIIVDGKLIKHNLIEFGLTETWLRDQLIAQDITSIKYVFYAELQSDGSLFIDKK